MSGVCTARQRYTRAMAEATKNRKKFAIIDGKSVFYRGYYAMPGLSTKDGTPTGGVYGFAVMALEVVKRLKPDYVCVAWDKPKTNIRKRLELYPAYKAGRKPAPADFYDQIPILHEVLEAFGWPLYELDDYEADDIMGTLAAQAKAKDLETMLVTSDLDMLQLINGHTHVYALKKGLSNIELFRPETFIFKYGIKPDQFLDLKALKGDSSDNIPGVPGIGEKGATELLKEFKTLDGVYENLDLIKDSTRAKLEAGKELAYLSKKLAAIWLDAPLKLDLKEVDGSKCDPLKLQQILQKYEFRTLARQLPDIMKVPESVQSDLPKLNVGAGEYIRDAKTLAQVKLPKTDYAIIHATSAKPHGREPLVVTLSPSSDLVITIDASMGTEAITEAIGSYLTQTPLVGYDIKSSLQVLREMGIYPDKVKHDVLVGAFLLNPLRREQSLDELAASDLDTHLSFDESAGVGIEPEVVSVIRGLYELQIKQFKDMPKVAKLAQDIEWSVIPVLADMEYEGIKLDTKYLTKMSVELEDHISDVQQKIYGYANQEFNIASPGQLSEILFTKLQLPTQGIKKGKTSYSTAANELGKLREAHPIIDLITEYRELTKLKNTYVDTLPNQVDENSRLHTTFALTVAQTGRLSSSDPNLQNIPVKTELGKRIRSAFIPEKGHVFVSADFSQFELRLAAYLSGDKDLIDQFNRDIDVHTTTAALVYGRDEEDVTKNMRRDAKAVNFGIMYGLGPHGLVQATGMTYDQAKHFIERYFEVRPKLPAYIESLREKAKNDGYVETMYGRRRPTPDVHSSNFAVREAAYRQAVNMPLQGSAADIMKLAMTAAYKKLAGSKSKMLLQIHDSVLVESPIEEADKVAKLLKDSMESVVKLPIKLTVDTAIGKNWGEL